VPSTHFVVPLEQLSPPSASFEFAQKTVRGPTPVRQVRAEHLSSSVAADDLAQNLAMKYAVVAVVAAASAEAALGFAPVAPAAPRSGVLALRAQVCARG